MDRHEIAYLPLPRLGGNDVMVVKLNDGNKPTETSVLNLPERKSRDNLLPPTAEWGDHQ